MDQLQPAPNAAELFHAAVHAFRTADWAHAESLCRQVLATDPRNPEALHLQGLVFRETGRLQDAIASLEGAVAEQSGNGVLWTNLGETYRNAGRLADALQCQQRAISLTSELPEAHFNLGVLYRDLGRLDDAIASVRRAISMHPDYPKAKQRLGCLLRDMGRREGAVRAFTSALQSRPGWPEAHFDLGVTQLQMGQPVQAIEHFREVLRLDPARSSAEQAIGHALLALGRIADAKVAYGRASALGRRDRVRAWALYVETLADVVAPDRGSIDAYKARVNVALQAFAARPAELDLSQACPDAPIPSAMLAYYGGNVRPIMEAYADSLGALVPRLSPRPRRRGIRRLGIVVTDSHETIFARCWGGIAQRLSRELFEITLACSRAGANLLRKLLKIPESEYQILPGPIEDAARLLRAQEFDWLHYWEIGTDQMNYYLPFFRPAPGQSTCWGWPVTSGNPQVDSYLSCEQLEPPDGPSHYTERLVLLRHLPTYYVRPPAPAAAPSRGDFGLKESDHLYLCTQNPRKYHPDFDPLLADLLRSDPQGVLLIVGDRQPSISELLIERFRRTMPDVVSSVRVIPFMEQDEYLSLVSAADMVLDTLHYGGGANTVYDAVAAGTPIVTMPGEFHRSRWAAAVNRRLGLERLIASTPQEYVAKAIEVATNPDLREALRKQILEAGADLFEDSAVVAEHDEYFSQAIAATRAGGTLMPSGQVNTSAAPRRAELPPDFAEAHYQRGNALREEGSLQEAVAAFQAALQIAPDWVDAHLGSALAWLDLGEFAHAAEHYRHVVRLFPVSEAARRVTRQALVTLGELEERAFASAPTAAPYAASKVESNVRLAETEAAAMPARRFNWVFLDMLEWEYDVAAPLTAPLGGSQSALCYLATSLAARGHRVSMLTGTKSPRSVNSVRCISHDSLPPDVVLPQDTIVIVLNGPAQVATRLRSLLPRTAMLVLWTQHAHDQPPMHALLDPVCAALWDRVVCVSDWQRTMYRRCLQVPENRLDVLRNAISPAFERMFRDASELGEAKSGAIRLAYTSTPFRGLDVLLSCFPEIRRRQKECRLDVFSSMQVYRVDGAEDEHRSLYEQCRATEGIDYRGSVSQTQLARELRGVRVLAYPNTFAETSCIAVMEALAAGALVVTSDLGALAGDLRRLGEAHAADQQTAPPRAVRAGLCGRRRLGTRRDASRLACGDDRAVCASRSDQRRLHVERSRRGVGSCRGPVAGKE